MDKTLTYDWGKHSTRCSDPTCAGCVPHPLRAEVDEKVARARGGSQYDRQNTQLTHRICNLRKGDGRRSTQSLAPQNFQTARSW